jgi:uncharacterized protein (TIGR02001 family)
MNIFGTHSALCHVRIYSFPLFNLTIKEIIMMKSKLLNSLILAALAVPGVAMAEDSPFSGNVSLTTDYLYRGVTQTDHRGAIQGGFDYANPNGVYAGVWGSNISWLQDGGSYTAGASLELDTYAGYRNSFAEDFSYDVGFLRYNYSGELVPGTPTASTNEIYGLIGWKWITAKYSYSLGNLFGYAQSSGSGYFDLTGTYTLEGPAVDLSAHYGKQNVAGEVAGVSNDQYSYADYNVKAAKALGSYTWAFMISKTNVDGDSARGVLSVSHSM